MRRFASAVLVCTLAVATLWGGARAGETARGADKRASGTPAREDATPSPPPPAAGMRAFDPSQVSERMARLDSAEIYYAWGDHASVVRVLSKPVARRPRAQVLLGWSLYRLGRMPESVAAFEAGLEVAPENLDLMNGHAFALYRTGRAADAEAEFRRVLERNPGREESIRGLAAVLFTSQRFEECLPIVDRLLREHPGDAEAEHHLMKSVDGMLSAWRQQSRTPAEMVVEAWRKADAGERRSALEMFRWVLQVDPFHPGARLGLGTLGPAFGREAEARRCLEELLHENPDDAKARAALARLHLDAGRVREAGAEVDQLLASQPKDPQGLALRREVETRAREKKL
jgi:tetratricopeptide (TPR) repeat protein